MASRERLNGLHFAKRLIVFLLLFLSTPAIQSQSSSDVIVEFVTTTSDEQVLLHLRLPRGQSIEEAKLVQNEAEIVLESDVIALAQTQFIILDASDAMVNFQQFVQSNISRVWQSNQQDTSLIYFDEEATVLFPTDEADDINAFLDDYSVTPGTSACLGTALNTLNEQRRDTEQSWRILIITTGEFAAPPLCNEAIPDSAPSYLDIIAITSENNDTLQTLVDLSGGQFYIANLRSIEERINGIVTEWGKQTYAVSGNLTEEWNLEAPFELDVTLSNGDEEAQTLTFRDYNLPIIETETPPTLIPTLTTTIEATAISTDAPLATVFSATEVPEIAIPESSTSDNPLLLVLIIIGAVLFVSGAVVLALVLSRARRTNSDNIPNAPADNFYATLNTPQPETPTSQISTRVRENHIIAPQQEDPSTQLASLDDTQLQDDDASTIDDIDSLLVTQVLTDDRFRSMMEQSESNDEIIGWVRLLMDSQAQDRDFELTRRGLVVGRSQECDIQVIGDRAISRKHARLDVRSNDQVTVSRLSAVNPVIVGGVQVSNRHPLESYDVIHLSDETRLIFIEKQDDDHESEEENGK